jgi:hypothetical protein
MIESVECLPENEGVREGEKNGKTKYYRPHILRTPGLMITMMEDASWEYLVLPEPVFRIQIHHDSLK